MNAPLDFDTRHALRAVLDEVPALAQRIGVDAAAREARRVLPYEGFALFRKSGLGLLRIPVDRGGLGGSLVDLFEVIAAIGAEESNVAHALRIHFDQTESLRLTPRSAFNDLQVQRIVDGAIFGGASTERGTTRPGEITTALRRDDDHYRVSGKKYYSTGTAFADYARINVKDADGADVFIIIPTNRPGFSVVDDWDGMG